METFEIRFKRISDKIEQEGITAGFDNIMGLTYLDAMVDIITQSAPVRDYLHTVIRKIITDAMLFEFDDGTDESMIGYV